MPKTKYEIRRKCEYCGATFLAKTIDSYYCSRKCSEKAFSQRKAMERKHLQMDRVIEQIPEGRDYISVAEAEAMFGVCKETIRRYIRRGSIPYINIGKRLTRISKSALMEIVPLREKEPLTRERALPKKYSLEPEDCYTIGEIAEKYPFDDKTIYTHIRRYAIPMRQIGKFVYVPKTEIDNIYKDLVIQ